MLVYSVGQPCQSPTSMKMNTVDFNGADADAERKNIIEHYLNKLNKLMRGNKMQ